MTNNPTPTAPATLHFARGAQSATHDLFSPNHHIYRDQTAFAYDITLTKVDPATNRNERVQLTLYRSNSLPSTYATHVKTSGTGCLGGCSTPAPVGSGWVEAWGSFRKVFVEKTGVEWGDRGGVERRGREEEEEEGGKKRDGGGFVGSAAAAVAAAAAAAEVWKGDEKGVRKTSGGAHWRVRAKVRKEREVFFEQRDEELRMAAEDRWRGERFRYKMPPEGTPRGVMPW